MNHEMIAEQLFEVLINGDRAAARSLIADVRRQGITPRELASEVFWPTYETLERLYRNDQLTALSYRLATRLLRVLVDQTAASLPLQTRTGQTIFASCGPSEGDELGAQIAVDLLESHGYTITFSGGGVAADEILSHVQQTKPDILLMFCSAPSDLPGIRGLIDTLREIGASGGTRVVVGGGVFNRADGLADEIGADQWASDPMALLETLTTAPAPKELVEARAAARKRRKAA